MWQTLSMAVGVYQVLGQTKQVHMYRQSSQLIETQRGLLIERDMQLAETHRLQEKLQTQLGEMTLELQSIDAVNENLGRHANSLRRVSGGLVGARRKLTSEVVWMRKNVLELTRQIDVVRQTNKKLVGNITELHDVTHGIKKFARESEGRMRNVMQQMSTHLKQQASHGRHMEKLTRELEEQTIEKWRTILWQSALAYESRPRNGKFSKDEWDGYIRTLPKRFRQVKGVSFEDWSEETPPAPGSSSSEKAEAVITYEAAENAIDHILSSRLIKRRTS